MNRRHGEALSAFFDGEPVDDELLAESLAQPGAAALLAEFATMRAHVQRDRSRPGPEFYERMGRLLKQREGWRLPGGRLATAALAASVLLATGLGGFLLGTLRDERQAPGPLVASRPSATPAPVVDVSPPAAAPPRAAPPVSAPKRPGARLHDATAPPPAALRIRLAQWREEPERR